MKVGIDNSPLTTGHFLSHRVRGTGFYLKNLKDSLLKYHPENEYIFFKRGDRLPSGIDIIHYPYFEPYFITLPIKKKLKTVVTVHDLTPLVFKDKFPAGIKGNLKWKIQKKTLAKSDRIIADSQCSKNDIVKYVGFAEEKIDVVYLAVSDHFKPSKKSDKVKIRYGLPDSFLLYVGDVTWNKNLPGIIEAVGKTEHLLIIVGQAFKNEDYDRRSSWNQDLAKAQELARKNKKIISLGFVSDEDLVALYNLATALVMPSFYEGFGLPVLEAMQSGCPVITSKSGSIPEVCESAVFYVDSKDPNSIAYGISRVMADEKLKEKLSKQGLRQAEKFTWEKTAKETIKAYQKIISSSE